MDELLADFCAEAADHLDALEHALLSAQAGDGEALNEVGRRLHSLKGAAACLALPRIERIAHAAETLLARGGEARALLLRAVMRLRDVLEALVETGAEAPGDDGDLIAAAVHDRLPTIVDTLQRARERLLEISANERDPRLNALLARISHLGAELADAAATRPIADCFARLPALVANDARREGKAITLSLNGDLAIDDAAVAPLREALTHLVRNACSHGIEPQAARRAAGKPETGHIRIDAYRAGDCTIIEVCDDGRGLDVAALRADAIRKGFLPADALRRMADAEIARLALAPGISTAVEITTLSGRGVGLDAARAAIARLGGDLTIAASDARGASFVVTIPDLETHAIVPRAAARESAA